MLDHPRRRRVEPCIEMHGVTTAVLHDEEAVKEPEREHALAEMEGKGHSRLPFSDAENNGSRSWIRNRLSRRNPSIASVEFWHTTGRNVHLQELHPSLTASTFSSSSSFRVYLSSNNTARALTDRRQFCEPHSSLGGNPSPYKVITYNASRCTMPVWSYGQ